DGSAPKRSLPRHSRQRTRGARLRVRKDAALSHPRLPGRPRSDRAVAVRPDARTHRLPPPLIRMEHSLGETPRRPPRLRGVLHQVAFLISLVVGPLLVAFAHGGSERVSAAVFTGSVAAMLGASALYHRVWWSPRVRPWMRRLDHAGIYVLIAGTYTPVGLLSLHGALQTTVL